MELCPKNIGEKTTSSIVLWRTPVATQFGSRTSESLHMPAKAWFCAITMRGCSSESAAGAQVGQGRTQERVSGCARTSPPTLIKNLA